jgi:hypothetical protein
MFNEDFYLPLYLPLWKRVKIITHLTPRGKPDLIEDLHDVGQVDLSQLGGGAGHPVALVRGLGGTVQTARGQRLQQRLLPRLCLCLLQSSSEIIKKDTYNIAVLWIRIRIDLAGSGSVLGMPFEKGFCTFVGMFFYLNYLPYFLLLHGLTSIRICIVFAPWIRIRNQIKKLDPDSH